MNKMYEDELAQLKTRMEGAERFAEKIPVLANIILGRKYTGTEEWIDFGGVVGNTYFPFSIRRGKYKSGTSRAVTNHKEEHNEYLFCMYINTITEYDSYNTFGLDGICNKVDVFFYDKLNSTFYITDDNIGEFIREYKVWHEEAIVKVREGRKATEIEELRNRLAQLENDASQNQGDDDETTTSAVR